MKRLSNTACALATGLTWLTLAALPWVVSPHAQADETLITARIEGTQFINTTRKADWCSQFSSGAYCTATSWGINLPITYTKAVDVNSTDNRNKVYVKLPARQAITLQNQLSGQTATMFIAFDHFSQRVSFVNDTVLAGVEGGCGTVGGTGSSPVWTQQLWYTLSGNNPSPCYSTKTGNAVIENSQFTRVGVSIRPEFPAIASLTPGRWEGVIDYPVGPGRGFDFGNLTSASTDVIRFRVSFVVQQDIRVDFPANGSELRLVPQGGWATTMNSNRAPERLYHNSPLRLWAAAPLQVYLNCERVHSSTQRCMMRNANLLHDVQVITALTLPGEFTHQGQPIDRFELRYGTRNSKTITPSGSVTNIPGMLHFDVSGADAALMLRYPGARYSGRITIVYDATLS